MARTYVQDGYVDEFGSTIRAEHSITDVKVETFNTSGKRSLLCEMLIQSFSDVELRLIFKQFYEALTSEIINMD